VAGEVEHTLAAALSRKKILMSIQNYDLLDIFTSVLRKSRELRGHPPQIARHLAQHAPALRVRPIGKREPQIELRGLAQLGPRQKQQACSRGRDASRH